MPIDITRETVFPLALASDRVRVPPRRHGRKPAAATWFRWAKDGFRGVVLETLQVGGTKCTSVEAVQRFFDRLTAEDAARGTIPSDLQCSDTTDARSDRTDPA
jgi:hypothetical protein